MVHANGGLAGRKWTPSRTHQLHHQNGGGYFNTPFRFWIALTGMLLVFVVYVTYLNSSDSLGSSTSAGASAASKSHTANNNNQATTTSNVNNKKMASMSMSLAELERMAARGQETEDEEEDYNESSKTSSNNVHAKNGEEEEDEDADAKEAENSAAASDLMSNEAYPVYELPKGGSTLNRVQEEVNAADIPDFTAEPDDDEGGSGGASRVTDADILEDVEAYNNAPIIQSMPESSSLRYREIVLQHERYYRTHPSRLYVPKLKKTARLSIAQFAERFVKHSQPVIIPYEAMRHLGFTTKSYTLDEMLELYPNYKRTFIYKYGNPGPGELDLGPAVWALKQGDALRKTATGRNFPRNTKISLDKLSRLNIQNPPYIIPGTPMLAPSLWFATITSSTKLHSDCCDNYAMMISGTKRWTVAPPNEARILQPTCYGGLCWVKKLEHPDEHASTPKQQELAQKLQKVTFDLGPNEMLYLPTGWFHHVENVGPTIMINFWTRGGPGFLKFLDGSMTQTLADFEKEENSQRSRRRA